MVHILIAYLILPESPMRCGRSILRSLRAASGLAPRRVGLRQVILPRSMPASRGVLLVSCVALGFLHPPPWSVVRARSAVDVIAQQVDQLNWGSGDLVRRDAGDGLGHPRRLLSPARHRLAFRRTPR